MEHNTIRLEFGFEELVTFEMWKIFNMVHIRERIICYAAQRTYIPLLCGRHFISHTYV